MHMEKGKKLKILAASDFHGMNIVSRDLAKRAEKEKVDLIIIAGDILDFGEYAKNMIKPFIDKKMPVLFVPGNHDSPEAVENFIHDYNVRNIDGGYAIFGDDGFFGSGGSTNLPSFPGYTTEKEVYYHLKTGFDKIKEVRKKIMVTHEHPSGSMIEEFSGIPGSKSIAKALEKFQPDIHICGHIHPMEGFQERIGKTHVFSVGKRGTIIEI
jgi:uncharacterized protein